MRIAVTYDNGQIFQHFGMTEHFKVYDIEDGEVVLKTTVGTNGKGHGALVGILKGLDVDALICGGIGSGAHNGLIDSGIELYAGVTGDADDAVEKLLAKSLDFSSEPICNHHDHDHQEGNCSDHGCGSHHD